MTKYTVVYALGSDGWWTATVRGVKGAHTQGRSIAQTRRRIREALGLFVADVERAELVDHIRVKADARSILKKAFRARRGLEQKQKAVSRLSRSAARKLTSQMSVRDASEILGVSPQRVQQLAAD